MKRKGNIFFLWNFFFVCVFLSIQLCVFISCNSESLSFRVIKNDDTISVDKKLLNGKHRFKEVNGTLFLQGYIPEKNEIVLYDIDSTKTILALTPELDYREENDGRFIQFEIYKPDSIFIITENKISIVNTIGKVIFSFDISSPVRDSDGVEYRLWDNDNQFPLKYEANEKNLIIRTIRNCSFLKPEYTTAKIETKFNLDTRQFVFFDYSFPVSMQGKSCGQAVFPFREINDDDDILSFQSSDSIFVFNRSKNKMKSYLC